MSPHHMRQALERSMLLAREAVILSTPGSQLGRALPEVCPDKRARAYLRAASMREQLESRGIARMALERGDLASARLALGRLYPSFRKQLQESAELHGWRWPEGA